MIRVRLLSSLRHDERGVSAVEFAFLIPILATLILGIIDLSTGLQHRFTLQQAVNRSLEIVQANRVAANSTGTPDYDFLRQEVATAANVPVGNVTLNRFRECNGVRATNFVAASSTEECASDADTARYLELIVTRDFRGKMYLRPIVLRASSTVRIQ
jgi:Flp pilus assembly protein TadG